MTDMIGADVEALERLAMQFEQSAERLRHQAGAVGEGVRVSAWVGPVALRFQLDWDSTHSVQLKQVAEALGENARSLRKNAAEQRAASASLAGDAGTRVVQGRPVAGGGSVAGLGPADYLEFSKAAYGGHDLPDGWTEVSADELEKLGIDPESLHTPHGLDATIATDGQGNYVLAFQGSTNEDGNVDWNRENKRAAFGSGVIGGVLGQAYADVENMIDPGSSTQEAVDLGLALKSAVGEDHMAVTGHSLGGRHAAAAGAATGATTVTFNAAGLTNDDVLFIRTVKGDDVNFFDYAAGRLTGGESLRSGLETDNITNYSTSGDPLTNAQKYTAAYDAAGTQIVVDGPDHNLESFDGQL